MDSMPGEDPSMPLNVSSAQISMSFDVAGEGEDHHHHTGSSGFGSYVNDRLSLSRAHTMKDFEMQITDLKKENFKLKLRIYFLEEKVQQKCDSGSEDLYRTNIELKVEVESLKHDLQEKQNLLVKASKAVESLAGDSGSKIQRLKEESLKQLKDVEDSLKQKIQLLEKEVSVANEEVEKIAALLDQERLQRINANEKLSEMKHNNAMLEERDGVIEQLNQSVKSKEALILQLEQKLSSTKPRGGSADIALQGNDHLMKKDREEDRLQASHGKPEVDGHLDNNSDEAANATKVSWEMQQQLKEMDNVLNDRQQKLQEKEAEIALQKKNAFKRDKTIQGLTVALKHKDKENNELLNEIESLNVSLAKARELVHKAQVQNFKGVEDYQGILIEKEQLLTKQHASMMGKEKENRKLLALLQKKDTELDDLYEQQEQLRRELDAAQQEKICNHKTINDLNNQLEKLNQEMLENESTLQLHCELIINEHRQQLQDQELVIIQLRDNLHQTSREYQETKVKLEKSEHPVCDHEELKKELDIKEECIHKLNLAIQERDQEAKQLANQSKTIQQSKELLEKVTAQQIKEKDFIISELQELLKKKEPEGEKEPEYRQLIRTLKAEQEMYSRLIQSARGAESLQNELDAITLLRKRLEADIQEIQELRRVLKDQIMAARWRESDTISFLGDQTSYFSICHDNLDQHSEHLSVEELRGKVTELMLLIKEMQTNSAVKKDPEHTGNFLTKETQTDTSSEIALLKTSEDGKQTEDAQQRSLLIDFHQSPCTELTPQDASFLPGFKDYQGTTPGKCGRFEAQFADVTGLTFKAAPNPFSPPEEHESGLKHLSVNQREIGTETEDFSADINDLDVETFQHIVTKLRKELKDLKQKSVLHPPGPCSECNSNVSKLKTPELHDEATGDGEHVQHGIRTEWDSETEQITLHSKKNLLRHGDVRSSFQLQSAKKSRIPVPLKQASRSKLGTETTGVTSEVQDCTTLQTELRMCQLQNHQLSEQLQASEIQIERLRASATQIKEMDTLCILDNSSKDPQDDIALLYDENNMTRDLRTKQSAVTPETLYTAQENARLQEELQICQQQNHQLSEQLQSAEIEVEKLKANEILHREMDTVHCLDTTPKHMQDDPGLFDEDNTNPDLRIKHSAATPETLYTAQENARLQEELQICQQQNHQLSEQLQSAEIEVEKLKANEILHRELDTFDNVENDLQCAAGLFEDNTDPDLRTKQSAATAETLYTAQEYARLQEELQICQQQNHQLSEQLQSAEIEVERLKANEILHRDVSTLMYLDNSHKETDSAEQSFDADKTITNFSCLNEEHGGKLEVQRATARDMDNPDNDVDDEDNLEEQRGRIDNIRYIEPFSIQQTYGSQCVSGHRGEQQVSGIGSLCADPSLSRYKLLVQSQARELSAQRQQIKESHSLSVLCCRSFINAVKAFDELLQASDVDFYVAEGFREQLNQSIEWIKKLEYRLSHGELATDADTNEEEMIHRYNADTPSGEQLKQYRERLSSHHMHSEVEISEIIYVGSSYHNQEIGKSNPQELSQNLLIEHLEEIRKLRQRLEVSIKTNDMLRKQLERQITEAEQGGTYGVHKETHSELVSEIYHLRKQNEAFKYLIAKESRDKETEELRGKVSQKSIAVEHLTKDCERMKKDHEKMQQILRDKERKIGRLSQELASNCKQLARQQSERSLQHQQMAEQDQLIQSLRVELKVYEHFHERDCRTSAVKASQQAAHDVDDANSDHSADSSSYMPSRLVPGHRVWADKHGRHVLGLVEDISALRKQISEGGGALQELEAYFGHDGQTLGFELPEDLGIMLSDRISRSRQCLEEAGRLTKLLWRVSLPGNVRSSRGIIQDEEMRMEILRLRKKLSEQEKKFSGTVKRLHTENQMKDDIERVILNKLTLTHEVLKKARGNLEMQPMEIHH